jgi:hypothetical protein
MTKVHHAIGIPGQAWQDKEKQSWLKQQTKERSYQDEVLAKLNTLSADFERVNYGDLNVNLVRYPLYAMISKQWQASNKNILVTGGVHGYETSGVQGAIRFLQTHAKSLVKQYNIVVIPCVSPWGYETINRWNDLAIDPNRSFYKNSPAQESLLLMTFLDELDISFTMHIDLHETTDTDNSTFRPALSARDAIEQKNWNIPDGFYLVGDSTKPAANFQQAIIKAVSEVTHIAPADEAGKLIGVDIEQFGVINYAGRALGLCMGLTDAQYVTTTEVYPDSPLVDDENCINAQVAAILAAIQFI